MAERGPRGIPEPKQSIPDQLTPIADHQQFDGLMQEAERLPPNERAQINQAADELQLNLDRDGIQPRAIGGLPPSETPQNISSPSPSHKPPSGEK